WVGREVEGGPVQIKDDGEPRQSQAGQNAAPPPAPVGRVFKLVLPKREGVTAVRLKYLGGNPPDHDGGGASEDVGRIADAGVDEELDDLDESREAQGEKNQRRDFRF